MTTKIGTICLILALIAAAVAWGEYCWRLALSAIVLLVVGAACLAVPANAQPVQPCAVQVVIDLQTYTGQQHFENFCLSEPALYGNGLLSVAAVSMGDGLFKSGFEVLP